MVVLLLAAVVIAANDVPVVVSVVAVGTVGGSVVTTVEGAVVTGWITLGGWEVDSPCFYFSAASSACSVLVNLSFSFMSNSIMSSSDFCCTTSTV